MNLATFGGTMLDLSSLPTRHPYTLALFQNHIERLLLGWVEELGGSIRRSTDVVDVTPDDRGSTFGSPPASRCGLGMWWAQMEDAASCVARPGSSSWVRTPTGAA